MQLDDATFVIRHREERTLPLCRKLLFEEGVKAVQVVEVSEIPFSKTLRCTYEAGVREGRRWTVSVDADLLIGKGAVRFLLEAAFHLGPKVFEIQGRILDKFSGLRTGGIKLYQTNLLEIAYPHITDSNERPEELIILKMASMGYARFKLDQVLSLHDYHQWNRDIFRKSYFYAHKFSNCISDWEGIWSTKLGSDVDYRVALLGSAAGRRDNRQIRSDTSQFDAGYITELLQREGVAEKLSLRTDLVTTSDVKMKIDESVPLNT